MKLRISLPAREAKKLKQKIVPLIKTVEKEDFAGDEFEMVSRVKLSGVITM